MALACVRLCQDIIRFRLSEGGENGCATCAQLQQRFVSTTQPEAKQVVWQHRLAHRQYFQNQRALAETNVQTALRDPLRVMSSSHDGYDKNKTGLPMYPCNRPSTLEGYIEYFKLKFSVVIFHGRKTRYIVSTPWVRTGGNLAVTCWMHAFGNLPSGTK